MIDLLLYETGNGGDLVLKNTDLEQSESIYNSIYLALFGGNTEAITRADQPEGTQRYDYWANGLFWRETPEIQFNSQTERLLNESPITSASRLVIEEIVKADLAFLNEFGEVQVTTTIPGLNKLEVTVTILEPSIQENKIFRFIWDATKKELITETPGGTPFDGQTNWQVKNYLNGIVTVWANSLKITVGAGANMFAVISNQSFIPGRRYLIQYNVLTFSVDAGDDWGVGFGSNSSLYAREGAYAPATGTGWVNEEVIAETEPDEPDNLRLLINASPLSFGTAGVFEIENLIVKRLD